MILYRIRHLQHIFNYNIAELIININHIIGTKVYPNKTMRRIIVNVIVTFSVTYRYYYYLFIITIYYIFISYHCSVRYNSTKI